MPLQKNILTSQYKSFFNQVHENKEEISIPDCVDIWLDTYDQYVKTGQDPSGDSVAVVNLPAAKSALISGFSSNAGEQALKAALSAYWSGATFNIAVPHATMSQEATSVVTSFNLGVVGGVFSGNFESPDEAAKNLANKLDDFTKTVNVLITGLAKTGSPPPTITAAGTVS